ncbi:YbaB/EbfC family nucleoid-associated protein [Saccharopolyspora oryzae]|uniref:YbaB/EbfC family nucleoid-associated protein n=1 Tax=Saccharopolyspora oryzae TaxID=2997343 RepID=A0ABT4V656_9PSEU|nr:YbaB/EbfC family nucleoid-associated protein [Saccharopolyspora oryzae]MDA3629423.1 YbaB/EbfC family nucleoid-associated protein [Saccharopolyspora oryzae]
MHPDDWLTQYNTKLQQLKEDTDRAKSELSQLGATTTSRDGQITVRVNSSGALEDIEFSRDFPHPKPDQVAATIMECVRQAQRQAAGQMVEVMQQFVGDGTALDFVKSSLPHGYTGDGTDPDEAPKRPAQPDEDDDYDNGGSFLR